MSETGNVTAESIAEVLVTQTRHLLEQLRTNEIPLSSSLKIRIENLKDELKAW